MNLKTLTRSYAGGEIAPELYGRLDLTKFQTGLARASNFEILPHGPARNRAGFGYINEAKFSAKATVVRPFSFSTTQTYIIEFGDQYIRWHTNGGTLLSGVSTNITGVTQANPGVVTSVAHGYANGQWLYLASIGGMTQLNGRWVKVAGATANTYQLTDLAGNNINTAAYGAYTAGGTATPPYEIVSPFLEADLFNLHFTQSADVLTVTHPSYDPQEIKRLGAASWTIGAIAFSPTIAAPAAPATANGGPGGGTATVHTYVTTALATSTLEESLPSAATAAAAIDLTVAGNYTDVTPAAVAGAVRYNVYKLLNGLYGFVGQTDGSALRDNNITPDVSKTPAIASTPFAAANDKPGAVGYFSGRRGFAGTNNKPQNYWMTRTDTESNLSYSIPTRDDDTIAKRIIAQEVNRIYHMVPIASRLIMLTSGGVWEVFPQNSDVLTPASADAKQQSNDGASNVAPIITGRSVLYTEDATNRIREIKYSVSNNQVIFDSNDISVMAPHLFDGYTITDSAYVKAPYKMAYYVRSDGTLLGCTYMPEHEVIAWHQHSTTSGTFESIAAVKESSEYPLYAVIRRTINARSVRYIERQHTRRFTAQEDAFFVDSGLTYSGAATGSITGLYHLEGATVNILTNGAEHPQKVVTAGTITLDSSTVTKAHIGLPITSQLQTLPLSTEADQAFGQATKKTVGKVYVRVKDTETVKAGPTFAANKMREYPARSSENYDTPPALKTNVLPLQIDSIWGYGGQVCVEETRPLPITILSMSLEVALGG